MVKILANGEIVQDNDPRVSNKMTRPKNKRSSVHSGNSGTLENEETGQNSPTTMLGMWNEKLLQQGIPRWNIGNLVIEPLMTVMMLIVLVFFGIHGLLFLGLLFFVVKMSRGSATAGTENQSRKVSPPSGRGNRLGR